MQIKIHKGYIEFDEISTIKFYSDEDEMLVQIDPTDLTALYGAWCQMRKEQIEEERLKKI